MPIRKPKGAIICIAIVAELIIHKRLGKKKLVECGMAMVKVDEYTYCCEQGHQRHYPAYLWESRGLPEIYQIEILRAHQKLES